ncbi:MAG: D-alanine--D-alanine ligase [Proteobacteria bacterium]|nr:D-alanine--D-alanine ligase [Pseudomonadota bacterium]MBU1387390.1 D-alanine--D-alanine ligase [Pseudomonadota bacterium]MBU1541675.1 D-alanine--D-alanine ligase [Pseudomonadota bacterium]MBU2431093.1 D-alanine--D-alanine ligase [Pseudomonadota bacterium]MBU2482021.1 D-alanine--D-alanine ligase [Pseudomonadota bacterium]
MKIGLTYDLRSDYLNQGYSMEETAEFDKESTIEGLETAIQNAGHHTERIGNARQLMKKLLEGETWDMVFNICEGLYGDGRESLVPALLDLYKIPYVFSGPVTLGVGLNKGFAKQIVRDSGVNTPAFHVVSDLADIQDIDLEYPLFAKPVFEGTGKGIDSASKLNSKEELEAVCKKLLTQFSQPVLVEEYLPGREFTVGVLGTGDAAMVPGAMEIVYKQATDAIYSYENKENYEQVVDYIAVEGQMLEDCKKIALAAWKALNCFDGGRIDVRVDRFGKISFIEVNPLAGLNPQISDLPILCRLNNVSYQDIINTILASAIKRNFPA